MRTLRISPSMSTSSSHAPRSVAPTKYTAKPRTGKVDFLEPRAGQISAKELGHGRNVPRRTDAGCQHGVLSFYQPPTEQQLERAAPYSQVS
jgi:hypothetical protein